MVGKPKSIEDRETDKRLRSYGLTPKRLGEIFGFRTRRGWTDSTRKRLYKRAALDIIDAVIEKLK